MYYDPVFRFIYEVWGRHLNRRVEGAPMRRPDGLSESQAVRQSAGNN